MMGREDEADNKLKIINFNIKRFTKCEESIRSFLLQTLNSHLYKNIQKKNPEIQVTTVGSQFESIHMWDICSST